MLLYPWLNLLIIVKTLKDRNTGKRDTLKFRSSAMSAAQLWRQQQQQQARGTDDVT